MLQAIQQVLDDEDGITTPALGEAAHPAVGAGLSEQRLTFNVGKQLSDAQLLIVQELLMQFRDTFAAEGQLGRCQEFEFAIDTGEAKPIKFRPRPLLPAKRHALQALLKELLHLGIIRPSSSPWGAPVVLVRKSDGSYRFTVDYREINKVTRHDCTPLPRLDDTLAALGGCKYFSTLDLLWGYYQLPVSESTIEKTAFVVPGGHYEMCRVPMGMSTSPAHFQKSMQMVLSGLDWRCAIVFVDDIIIFDKTFESHRRSVAEVLGRLRKYNLCVKPSKCHFFKDQVSFLGHLVTSDGLKQAPSKLAKLRAWPEPKSAAELRTFLGFAGFYRHFVQDFASVAAPLTVLTAPKLRARWPQCWTEECKTAFRSLIEHMLKDPILIFPDFTRAFHMCVDASKTGMGAVLWQPDSDGNERPISFASKLFKPSQTFWAAVLREAYALGWAVEKHKKFIMGASECHIYTDHRALVFLHSKRDISAPRLACVFATLAQYQFTLHYRKGKENITADAMSRIPAMLREDLAAMEKMGVEFTPEERAELIAEINLHEQPLIPQPTIDAPTIQLMSPADADEFMACTVAVQTSSACPQGWLKKPQKFSTFQMDDATKQVLIAQIRDRWPCSDLGALAQQSMLRGSALQGCQPEPSSPAVLAIEATDWYDHTIMTEAQSNDVDLQYLVDQNRTLAPGKKPVVPKNASYTLRTLARLWPSMTFKDGLWYRKVGGGKSKDEKLLLYVPPSQRPTILRACHDAPAMAHCGSRRMINTVCNKFYWPQTVSDIKVYLRSCLACRRRKAPRERRLQPARMWHPDRPMQVVSIDFKGPLPKTRSGNRYLCGLTCLFSKWPEVTAVPNNDANTAAYCLLDFMARHGVPEAIMSDQGAEFEATLFRRVCQLLGIEKRRTAPLRPQTDGVQERYFGTLGDALAILANNKQNDWDEHVPMVLAAYRMTPHEVTGWMPTRSSTAARLSYRHTFWHRHYFSKRNHRTRTQ